MAALLLSPARASAALAVVQHKVNGSSANANTITITVTATGAGNLLVVGAGNAAGPPDTTIASVSDGTNTFTHAPNSHAYDQITTGYDTDMYYLLSSTAGKTTITITFNGAAATYYKVAWFWEVSGFTSAQYDAGNNLPYGLGSGTTVTGAGVPTSSTTGFVAAIIVPQQRISTNPKAGNEFTSGGDISATPGFDGGVSLISSTAALHTPVWVDNTSGDSFVSSIAAFREGANPSGIFVQQNVAATSSVSANTLSIPVTATGAGNLLVVATSNNNPSSVASVSDGTNTFTHAGNTHASDLNYGFDSNIFYLPSSTAGKTSLTVTFNGAAGTYQKTAWFWEVSVFSNVQYDLGNNLVNGAADGAGVVTGTPAPTSGTTEFVVGTATVGSTVTSNPKSGNEFTYGGNVMNGDGAVSLISSTAATHTPVWVDDNPGDEVIASTAAFRNGPNTSGLIIQQSSGGETSTAGTTFTIPVDSTGSGNLLVVATMNDVPTTVHGVSDGTNAFVPATGAVDDDVGDGLSSDVWYLLRSSSGKTSVTVTFNATNHNNFNVWFWEVSGFSRAVFDKAASAGSGVQAGGTATGAAVTTTGTREFVVGLDMTSANVTANPKAGNEFIYGGYVGNDGNGACSLITTSPASHQPVWTDNGSSFAGSTAAFKDSIVHKVTSY